MNYYPRVHSLEYHSTECFQQIVPYSTPVVLSLLEVSLPFYYTTGFLTSLGSNWIEKQILVIQNAILFYDKVQSFYDPEIYKISTSELYSFPVKPEANKEAEAKDSSPVNEKFLIKIVQSLSKVLISLKTTSYNVQRKQELCHFSLKRKPTLSKPQSWLQIIMHFTKLAVAMQG